MQNIDQFVDKLVTEKGFATKDPEVVAQIKSDLMDRIEDQINAMIISNIPEDALDGFSKALDSKNEKEAEEYARKYIPDIEEKTASVLLAFKSNYLG